METTEAFKPLLTSLGELRDYYYYSLVNHGQFAEMSGAISECLRVAFLHEKHPIKYLCLSSGMGSSSPLAKCKNNSSS